MLRGSYYNGFAPRDGMPLYPSLWRGCIGAWEPSIGPTGLLLRDWSGLGIHGDFQNLTAANGWAVSQGRYAVSLATSSANRILCSLPVLSGTGNFTISAWCNPTNTSEFDIAGNFGTGNTSGVQLNGYGGKLGIYCASGATLTSVSTLQNGVWQHAAATRVNGVVSLYLNGVFEASGSRSASIGTARNWAIGNAPDYTAGGGGLVDSVMVHNRALLPNEIQLLASRRGIAYDLAPFRMPYSEQVATAARLRRLLLLGVGS